MATLEEFIKKNKILQESIANIADQKWKLMEIIQFNRHSIRNTKKALNHIKAKMGIMIRELQDLRDHFNECVDLNRDCDSQEMSECIDKILQDLKIMPATTIHKTKHGALPDLTKFSNCEMSIVIWKYDA